MLLLLTSFSVPLRSVEVPFANVLVPFARVVAPLARVLAPEESWLVPLVRAELFDASFATPSVYVVIPAVSELVLVEINIRL